MKFGNEALHMSPQATDPDSLDSKDKGPQNQEGQEVQPVSQDDSKVQLPPQQVQESQAEKNKNIENVKDALDKIYAGTESKETHEFSLEEIRGLLKQIDGKEHLDLTAGERIENIKGELMSLTFMSGEKETIEGEEHEISYLLTLAGQRYKSDGTPGRTVSKTFLTKDYDEGMYLSEEVADHIDGAWTNFTPVAEPTSNLEQNEVTAELVVQALDAKGIEDQETKELLTKYAIQCENDSEKKNPQDPNKAHFESALTLAKLYAKTEKYKGYALESLEELALGAHTISPEAVDEVQALINSLR